MAIKRVVTDVCDWCEGTEDVKKRKLQLDDGDRQLTFDACKKCRDTRTLSEWETLVPKRKTRGRGTGPTRRAETKREIGNARVPRF